jgi:RHS repeat-associated protein
LTRKVASATGNVTEYRYDHDNRLVSVEETTAGGVAVTTAEYTYDVFGRRIVSTTNGQIVTYVYDGANTWADFDDAGVTLARYLFGETVDEILARWQPDGKTAWYLKDRLGSVRDIADVTGAVLNHISYDSFGQVLAQTAPAAGDRFLFTAREWDAAISQFHYRARYYDPNVGRFTSLDPLGFHSSDTNLYRYVRNQPILSTDPLGLVETTEYGLVHEEGHLLTAQNARLSLAIERKLLADTQAALRSIIAHPNASRFMVTLLKDIIIVANTNIRALERWIAFLEG